ncbi:hypothetical protein C0585_00980 [Candidatus Woesearchaeota archaeon]|uniref:hypothetical protein n=1 Tax=uncultured Arcobacter sp. TaxID=165434 RepID=UPI000CB0534A|nr:hypothetical protein [uncultured Arcobacter sp.]PLW80757.1 MAG: hypothetical protein C0585_00980 [Candidatus Woesearchaeota archaeon]
MASVDWTGYLAQGGTVFVWGILLIVGVIVLLGGGGWMVWSARQRKKYTLTVPIRLPRENNRVILSELAKGYLDVKRGSIIIKRKGRKPVASRPIDPKIWMQGQSVVEAIQAGPEDFIICLADSYKLVKDKDGKTYGLLDIIADIGKRKVWKTYYEREAKKAFTITDWANDHRFAIEMSILLVSMFIGFAILWTKV